MVIGPTQTRLVGAVLLSVAAPPAAETQQVGKLYRIGFLKHGTFRLSVAAALLALLALVPSASIVAAQRSEERRVGKECRL